MNARMYNPTVGQFTTADTYFGDVTNPLTLNRYAYVLNNPVNMWDPSGHIPEWVGEEDHYENEHYEDIHRFVEWDWTLIGQGREEGKARQIDQYKDANYFYRVYEQDVYKWWTYNVIETTYDYNPNDPYWEEMILMGKGGRVTDNSDHTFEEYSIEGFEVPITPEEMALISKGILESYGPPPGERRMLYSIKQGFLNGESISQDVIIYGEGGKETRYNIYEREIKEVIGEPQIGQVSSRMEDSSIEWGNRASTSFLSAVKGGDSIASYGVSAVKKSGEWYANNIIYHSTISNSSSKVEAYRKIFDVINKVEKFKVSTDLTKGGAKSLGAKLGVGGALVTGGIQISRDLQNKDFTNEQKRKAVAIDVVATTASVIGVVAVAALVPGAVVGIIAGVAVGTLINYGTEIVREEWLY